MWLWKLIVPRIQNVDSEDVPDISTDEITNTLSDTKNNKAQGENKVTVESIYEGGSIILQTVQKFINECLRQGLTA